MRLATLPICLLLGCQGSRPAPAPVFPVQRLSHAVGYYVAAAPGACVARRNADGFRFVVQTDAPSWQVLIETDDDWENGYAGYDYVVRCDPGETFCSIRHALDFTTCRPGGWGMPVAYIGVTRADGVLTVVVRWPVEVLGELGSFAFDFQAYDRDGLFQLNGFWRADGVSWTTDAIDFSSILPGVPVDVWPDFNGDGIVDDHDYWRFRICGDRDGDGLVLREYADFQNWFEIEE